MEFVHGCVFQNMSQRTMCVQLQQERATHEYTQEKLQSTHKELEKLKDGTQIEPWVCGGVVGGGGGWLRWGQEKSRPPAYVPF